MTYAILGYAMIAVITILLLTNKANPIIAFICIPPIFALIAGYSISDINGFINEYLKRQSLGNLKEK